VRRGSFEAGALAKTVSDSFVCPYLLDFEPAELHKGPLTQFQAKRANKDDTWALIETINKALDDSALGEARLRATFDKWWPDLEQRIAALPPESGIAPERRPIDEMVAEILEIVRTASRPQTRPVLINGDIITARSLVDPEHGVSKQFIRLISDTPGTTLFRWRDETDEPSAGQSGKERRKDKEATKKDEP
jgi:hypothetical protein